MGCYAELSQFFSENRNVKVLILDTNNIQFYYQHQAIFTQMTKFAPYDLVLVPGWVQVEYGQSDGRTAYIGAIPKPFMIIDETEDFLQI